MRTVYINFPTNEVPRPRLHHNWWILALLVFAGVNSHIFGQGGIKSKTKTEAPAFTFNIFPNPNSGKFTVVVKDLDRTFDINVYNVIGEMVYHWESNGTSQANLEINLSKQPKGIYMVELDTEQANMIRKVVVDTDKEG